MSRVDMFLAVAVVATLAVSGVSADDKSNTEPKRPSVEQLRKSIISEAPAIKAEKVDHERLVVRRIDIVDENGVIRAMLAAPTPPPIVDGIQYRRSFDVSGLVLFDDKGNEIGGYGFGDVAGGVRVLALDHNTGDAIGWRVMPDGAVNFLINEKPKEIREPELGNRLIPGVESATRVNISVAANGQPAIALSDKNDRPRIRLTVTEEGYGAIEFLNAEGKVVETIAPEK